MLLATIYRLSVITCIQKLTLIALFVVNPLGSHSQVVFPITNSLRIYSSYKQGQCLEVAVEDGGDYAVLVEIKDKRKNWFLVDVEICPTDGSEDVHYESVWVRSHDVGVWGRTRDGLCYVLYKDRNRLSRKYTFPVTSTDGTFTVLDYRDGWYKVVVRSKLKQKTLWAPPESICPEYYNSCS